MEPIICSYRENCENSIGALVIDGLVLPRANSFDPLAKIWSSVRKRILEQFGVDSAALFIYDDEKEVISCSFCLNFSVPETSGLDQKSYIEKFEDTFSAQMGMFEDVIEFFLLDEFGYEEYLKLLKKGADKEQLNNLFNRFMLSINVRTPKDEKRKHRSRTPTTKNPA